MATGVTAAVASRVLPPRDLNCPRKVTRTNVWKSTTGALGGAWVLSARALIFAGRFMRHLGGLIGAASHGLHEGPALLLEGLHRLHKSLWEGPWQPATRYTVHGAQQGQVPQDNRGIRKVQRLGRASSSRGQNPEARQDARHADQCFRKGLHRGHHAGHISISSVAQGRNARHGQGIRPSGLDRRSTNLDGELRGDPVCVCAP